MMVIYLLAITYGYTVCFRIQTVLCSKPGSCRKGEGMPKNRSKSKTAIIRTKIRRDYNARLKRRKALAKAKRAAAPAKEKATS